MKEKRCKLTSALQETRNRKPLVCSPTRFARLITNQRFARKFHSKTCSAKGPKGPRHSQTFGLLS